MGRVFFILTTLSLMLALLTNRAPSAASALLNSAESGVSLMLTLLGTMTLWSGLMEVLLRTGDVAKLGLLIRKLFGRHSRAVARAAIQLAMTATREEETELKASLTEKDIVGAASDFGGTFVDSMMKMIERAVVAAKREGVISDTHREEGAVAGAAHDAVCQVSEKAMGFSVGGKIGVARSGEHVAVAVFFTVGLVHLNEVVVGMGHRAI